MPTIVMLSGNGPGVVDGVAHYTMRLLDYLSEARPEWNWIWVSRRPRWYASPFRRRGKVRLIQPSHTWLPPFDRMVATTLKMIRPSMIHVQEAIHSYYETGAAVRAVSSSRVPVVTTLHEFHTELASVRHTIALASRSAVVLANDGRTAERCQQHVKRKVDATWWSPPNVLPPPDKWGIATQPNLCVTFGTLSSLKNLAMLRVAVEQVRVRYPDLRWRIIGPFNPEQVPAHRKLREEIGAPWIEFTGGRDDLEDRELRTWIAEGAVMLLPFADGASPRRGSLQAGWAFGLPVITTPPPTEEPAIRSDENCLLASADDSDSWADKIMCVLGNQNLSRHLRAGSLAAAERHSWHRLVEEHLRCYDALDIH